MKFKTYLVGGAVRDAIMGNPSKDLDFVMLAPSFSAMREAILEDGCKIFVEKPEYLTIRANHPKHGAVDYAVARRDGTYSDGRRPDSTAIASDIEQDLSRRDFTMNALAQDTETGEILDPFNGLRDIGDKIISCVGSPELRLKEDRLRAFRALRFAVQKSFSIEQNTADVIRCLSFNAFTNVSTERIRDELLKMCLVNSALTVRFISHDFPTMWDVIESRKIWFRPTTEAK